MILKIEFVCKGTTKNAHAQEKRAIICKKATRYRKLAKTKKSRTDSHSTTVEAQKKIAALLLLEKTPE